MPQPLTPEDRQRLLDFARQVRAVHERGQVAPLRGLADLRVVGVTVWF
ncbi:MAG: hypothetical protein HZA54_18555, partial [Planctomycetes bacterium]|nr:hypothetical protein [Planctomycetota bacterium]